MPVNPLPAAPAARMGFAMAEKDKTHEERLAAALRENLRRRKAQARELDRADDSLPKSPERG